MTRKKVKLEYITNNAARRSTLKKRKKGLMKKMSELSTLCDVDACAIMYGPNNSESEVFPSTNEVHRIIARFHSMSEIERTKKSVNQEMFLRYRVGKLNEQVKKLKRDNREKELTQLMYTNLLGDTNLQGLTVQDLNDLTWIIDQSLKDINKRMDHLAKTTMPTRMAGPPVAVTPVLNENLIRDQNAATMANLAKPRNEPTNNNPMGFGGDGMIFPFGDNNNGNI